MPVLFIGHGSPMNALATKSVFAQHLKKVADSLTQKPKAILCISAHWETNGTFVTSQQNPKTIHDFSGFPNELFQVKYPAPGSPELAKKVTKLLPAKLDETWGLDHGTWSVLCHMYPKADIPVVQLSLNRNLSFSEHVSLGQKLKPLRDEGILILGSGNIVHNLRMIRWDETVEPFGWAVEFDEYIRKALEARDEMSLVNIHKAGSSAPYAVPTPEHYLPLLYCYGASTKEDKVTYPHTGFEYASLSMRAVRFGL